MELNSERTLNFNQRRNIELKKEFEIKNKETLVKLTAMLLLENFSWTFVGEADSYRRRPFPLKFLQYESSDYPSYVFESELSKAFNHVGDIPTDVDLSEYLDSSNTKKHRGDDN